jgi:hypothetical protein
MTVLREYRGPEDLQAQYRVWTLATEGLPFAWRSNMTNVRHISQHAARYPGARLYAERDGEVVGYIGTHDPLAWPGLGMAVPFGYPWTWPADSTLAAALYERMLEATPRVYAGQRIDLYIQRFRGSWEGLHAFVRQRGWGVARRDAIWSRVCRPRSRVPDSRPMTPADAEEAAALAAADPHGPDPRPDAAAIRQRFESGWQEYGGSWVLPGVAAFSLEVRGPWAEVKMFSALPGRDGDAIAAVEARAAELGAVEPYFTLRPGFAGRAAMLEAHGYRHADDDVFVRLDAGRPG